MKKLFPSIFLLTLLLIATGFTPGINNHANVNPGNVVYRFESGKMQCLSEEDSAGHTWVLFKSLDPHTTVEFNKIEKYQGKFPFVGTMFVEDTSAPCASWVNMQEIKIVVDPVEVEKTTLQGKKVYGTEKITVLKG